MPANFRSDNEAPVAPAIMKALAEANQGTAHSYAEDPWSAALDARFSELFETDVRVLPVSTGTVANSIALASTTPPWGAVYCHDAAHILRDEGGAPEFFGSGLRLIGVHGAEGKLHPAGLREAMTANEGHGVHSYEASALSLTQSTESGTVYTPEEIGALSEIARAHVMAVHMDGARFANAVASLGCAPADITWRAGVDMLSFGASKNGCLAAEALVLFSRHDAYGHAERLRKRSGHLLSKMRYVSAQLLAYTEDGLWLELAAHANALAARFARAVASHAAARPAFPVQANEAFVRWSASGFEALRAAGMDFHVWPGHDDLARFVFSWAHREEDVDALVAALGELG